VATQFDTIEDVARRTGALEAQLQEHTTAVETVVTRARDAERDLHPGEVIELQQHRAALVQARSDLEQLDATRTSLEIQARSRQIGEAIDQAAGRSRDGGLPSLVASGDTLTRLHQAVTDRTAVREQAGTVHTRAAVLTAATGADTLASQLSGVQFEPRRLAQAAGLTAERVSGVESAPFPVFGGDQADIVAEGALKPEFDSVTPGSATPQLISIWSDVSRQNLLTMTGLDTKLRSVLSARVAVREDLLLLSTVTGTAGIIPVVGALSADLVLEAAARISAGDAAAAPNVVAINPVDAPTLLGPDVGAGGTASPPFASFLPTIHGMSVYVTNHVAAGEAVLGAFNAGSRLVVGLDPTFLVDSMSQIKNNLVTILLEEAVALAVEIPTAFAHITAV
jgi:hypothetical protein